MGIMIILVIIIINTTNNIIMTIKITATVTINEKEN